ncbi:MAG TPA: hypothetical protein EYP30_06885 [Archaeoglobaceae archaeon]|nr:hypothetical protein [Archaeoglobaceae archaeon]
MAEDSIGELLLGSITAIFIIALFFFVALPRYYEVEIVQQSPEILKINPYLWGFALILIILAVLGFSVIAGSRKHSGGS